MARAGRRHRADHVHLGHDRARRRARCSPVARDRRLPRRPARRLGLDARRRAGARVCRCSTSTDWCSACSARCGPAVRCVHTGRPDPGGVRRRAAARSIFGVPTVWGADRGRPDARAGAAVGPAAGLGQRRAAGPVFAALRRAGRAGPGRALRHDRDADHPAPRGPTANAGRAGSACRSRGVETRVVGRRRRRLLPADGETIGAPADPRGHPVRRLPRAGGDRAADRRRLVPHRRRRRASTTPGEHRIVGPQPRTT